MSGFSQSGVGLRAHSINGDGTQSFAHSNDHNGLLGLNDAKTANPNPPGGAPAGNGVYGYTEVPNASGICGAVASSNTQGAGVTGIGPTAGRFFGNVVVTGDLNVAGVAFSSLLQRLAALEAAGDGHGGTPPGPGKPNISASFDKYKVLTITGSGFLPSQPVQVRLVRDADATSNTGTIESGADGSISTTEPSYLLPPSGEYVDLSATDGRADKSDATGVLWSNTVRLTVP